MATSLTLVSSTIYRFQNLQSILWYTHKGPNTFIKKIVLYLGALFSDRIITASESSFPLKFKKVTSIGHAINYEDFYRSRANTGSKDFLILSRISKSKNIEESIEQITFLKKMKLPIYIGGGINNNNAKKIIDVDGLTLVPGFIDTHLHIESSMLTPFEFDRCVTPRGVTTAICDPHEIANVCDLA